ncbi:hypothetical protein Cgig2_020563 [Carnegiea gigantea]|uniref:Uncharacterized protein n=1 Tax=Carnegiea gigantea TaxID=171969 RepID=A0A9Q1GM61_9CARY|nr:hypothetical protein Cgig2_020563 [Carnegiea gigantea]
MAAIKHRLGEFEGVYSDSRGRAGGLALLWRKLIKVSLISNSFNHIDVELEDFGARDKWGFTGVYGWPESTQKLRTYELLKQLNNESYLPWVIGGYDYTWWNRREADDSVEECLDRLCASIEWSLVFPNTEVVHLNDKLSDHLLILLKLNDVRRSIARKGKNFKFENMWAMEEGCRHVVEEAWPVGGDTGSREVFQSKLQACRDALTKWHSEMFGDIKVKIRKLSSQLEGVQDIQLRDKILNDIGQLR